MNILILTSSAFKNSHSKCIATKITSLIEQPENEVTHIDLVDFNIPIFGSTQTEDIERLKMYTDKADAIIIGTPNYHSSFSGVLKNALDHLSFDEFKNKPVALFCNSGGIHSSEPLTQLRIVMRGLHALVIPNQLLTSDKDFKSTDGIHELVDESLEQRISVILDDLLYHAKIYSAHRQ